MTNTPPIRAIIIDDEPLARMIVMEYLQSYPNITMLQECNDGFEGIKAIQQYHPDLIFLDIQMPKINGFEMLEVVDNPPDVIFTTAFDEYAIRAFEAHAVDYLLKPFSKDRFDKAVRKWLDRYANHRAALAAGQDPSSGSPVPGAASGASTSVSDAASTSGVGASTPAAHGAAASGATHAATQQALLETASSSGSPVPGAASTSGVGASTPAAHGAAASGATHAATQQALLETASSSPTQQQRIVVKTAGKIKIIPLEDIHYLEASDDYVKIHTHNGAFLKNRTMSYFEQVLDPNRFVRTHRSYIINVQQVTRIDPYEKDSHLCILSSGAQVPVSKAGYVKLKTVLGL